MEKEEEERSERGGRSGYKRGYIILIIPLLNELLSHRIWNKTRK